MFAHATRLSFFVTITLLIFSFPAFAQTDALVVDDTGSVGIGTSSPDSDFILDVQGKTLFGERIEITEGTTGLDLLIGRNYLEYKGNGTSGSTYTIKNVTGGRIDFVTNSGDMKLKSNGDATLSGTLAENSDISLKTNLKPLPESLSKITQLKGVSYNWKTNPDGEGMIGLTAQDVERVYPELVSKDEETGVKSVSYTRFVAPLIEAIKEQQTQIENQNQRISELQLLVKEQLGNKNVARLTN